MPNASRATEPRKAFSEVIKFVAVVAVIALGLTAGALLAEGMVLVPYWQSLAPDAFLAWYGAHAALLFDFFGPLEISAAGLIIVAALMSGIQRNRGAGLLIAAAVLAIAVLLTFPIYFKAANASFEAATLATDEVGVALQDWATWHWRRTLVAIGSFASALLGVRRL